MRRLALLVALLVAAAVAGLVSGAVSGHRHAAAGTGPEGVAIESGLVLAPAPAASAGTVDGIACQTGEQIAYHVHAHVAVFVRGHQRQVPAGIGIPGRHEQSGPGAQFVDGGSCFYWLHTHAADGIVHIESPTARTYTLGEFFDVWDQPLGAHQVGPERGPVTVVVDGRVRPGDPRTVPLTAHAVIELDVGTPLEPFHPVRFPAGL